MNLKKAFSVLLACLLLFTVAAPAVLAAPERVTVVGPKSPSVNDTVESYLRGYGCTDLTGTLTVTIARFKEGNQLSYNQGADNVIAHDPNDENIDFYAELSGTYVAGTPDPASFTYYGAEKENGAWKETSGSLFTEDRQYLAVSFVQTTDGVDKEQIYGDFGNGAFYFKITNSCVDGSAYVVQRYFQPSGGSTDNIFARIAKIVRNLINEIKAFFAMIFGGR